MFVNMDATAVFFKAEARTTIHHTVARAVSIRVSSSNNKLMTASISVASDVTKLPLSLIYRGKPNGIIEKILKKLLPTSIFG